MSARSTAIHPFALHFRIWLRFQIRLLSLTQLVVTPKSHILLNEGVAAHLSLVDLEGFLVSKFVNQVFSVHLNFPTSLGALFALWAGLFYSGSQKIF